MKQKIFDAVVDMASKVKFIEKPRHYETSVGTWLQGVSTVSSIIPKDWLAAWGAKEAVKFLGYSDYEGDITRAKEVLEIIKNFTPEQFIDFLKEAKGASKRKSKTALIDGKIGHQWLENFVKAKINKTTLPELPVGNLKRPIQQFLKWEKENISEWILSEALVCYIEKLYAGTLDGLALTKKNKLALIDFKFSNHISEDYYLQTAGYAATFEPYGINITERIIIRLPKTLLIEEWDGKNFEYKIVKNSIEAEFVKSDYQLDKETFFHCLPIKKWINNMQNLQKQKNI